jgi:hypothetical protein
MAAGEQLGFAVTGAPPHRTDRVDDVPHRKPAGARGLRVTGSAAAVQSALVQDLRPGGAMDRAVHAATAEQTRVRGIDDRIRMLVAGDVTEMQCDGAGHGRGSLLERSVTAISCVLMSLGEWLRSRLGFAVLLVTLTAGNYLVWLGWDQRYDVDAEGVVTGPYEPWQVIGLAVVLGGLAAFAGGRRQPEVAVAAIPVVITVCFAVDAATQTDTHGASLWPIGVGLVAVGSLAGTAAVANLVAAIAWRHERPRDVTERGS